MRSRGDVEADLRAALFRLPEADLAAATLEPLPMRRGCAHRLPPSYVGRTIARPDDVTGSWVKCDRCGEPLPLLVKGIAE